MAEGMDYSKLAYNPNATAPQAQFNSSPSFNRRVDVGVVGEGVVSEMFAKAEPLVLSRIEPGESFKGLAYCTKTIISTNIYDITKRDLSLTLIDGEGAQFTGKFWSAEDKTTYQNMVVYVEGTTTQFDDQTIRVRLLKISSYGVEVPKSLFFREIPKLEEEYHKLAELVRQIKDHKCATVANALVHKLAMIERFKLSPYKPILGTALGMKLSIINTISPMLYGISQISNVSYDYAVTLLIAYMCNLQILQDDELRGAACSYQVLQELISLNIPSESKHGMDMSVFVTDLLALCGHKTSNSSIVAGMLHSCLDAVEKSLYTKVQ